METHFTPELEDLHVGYECERQLDGKWIPYVFSKEEDWRSFHNRSIKFWDTFKTLIRTPYITKEQIEAEGWKDKEGNGVVFFKTYEDGSYYYFKFWNGDNRDDVLVGKYTPSKKDNVWSLSCKEIIFKGECKDINMFRLLIKKQLKIQ